MGSPNSPGSRKKFGHVLKLEKRDLSYADLHSEIMKNASAEIKNEELVKHMSKIPSYLERGDYFQDKALNFGVLKWGSLERWHYDYNNQTNDRSRAFSQTSSNTSSVFSTEGSSDRSTDRKTRRPSLQSHLTGKPLKEFKRKDEDSRRSRSLENSSEILSLKGKMKIQEGEFKESETVVLLKPRDGTGNSRFLESDSFDSNKKRDRKKKESRRMSFSDGSDPPETSSSSKKLVISEVKRSIVIPKKSTDNQTRNPSPRSKISDEKKSTVIPTMSTDSQTRNPSPKSKNSEEIKSIVIPTKSNDSQARNPSPKSKNSEEKKSTVIPTKSCDNQTRNPSPKSKNWEEKKSTVIPTKSNDIKGRNPSPTRRLIMGLIGKSSNSASTDNSSNSRTRSSPLKRLLDPVTKSKSKVDFISDSSQVLDQSKNGSSTVQALLQVAVKNGLPLFTFAVDNSNDVLAATMRNLNDSLRKDENSRIYTFFSILETKKKNLSWLNHRDKKGYNYIPNVVAQMNVSDRLSGFRDFVLFAVDLRPSDQQVQESNDELAAIVSDLYSTTVILPGGVHGVPSKGEPSPLIQRWRSGGSCDCGGWDLGCRVRVFGNKTKSILTEESQHICQYELFSQGEFEEENKAVFSISSFKSGIFSVEFNSSISVLQAFAICVAILDGRKSSPDSTEGENLSEKIGEWER